MQSWTERHRAFLVTSAAALTFIAAAAAAYTAFGHSIIARGHAGQSAEFVNRWFGSDAKKPLAVVLSEADTAFRAALALALAAYALGGSLYALARARASLRWVLPSLLIYWVAFELFVSPHLVLPLRLRNYFYVRDPDHLPVVEGRTPGWNSDALRATSEHTEFQPEDVNLVFLGDSFTYGMRVPGEQAFPAQVEVLLRQRIAGTAVHVANFGWTSSSPLLSYRRLADIGDKYHPDLVALFVDMTDFHDDVKWNNMIERSGIYWFYDKLPITLTLLERWLPGVYWTWWSHSNQGLPRDRYFLCEAPLESTARNLSTFEQSLSKIEGWAEDRGIPFVVFVLPRYFQYSSRECPQDREQELEGRRSTRLGPYSLEPFRYLDDLGLRVEYTIVSLLGEFQTSDVFPHCFEDDPHWNPAGHKIAAAAIARALEPVIAARLASH